MIQDEKVIDWAVRHSEVIHKVERWNAYGKLGYVESAFAALQVIAEIHKPVIQALPVATCLECQNLFPCRTFTIFEKATSDVAE